MKKIKIALTGANGRMGQEILKLMLSSKEFHASLALVRKGQSCAHFEKVIHSWEEAESQKIDVIIDFSNPEVFRQTLAYAQKNKIALISGTTGLTESDFAKIKKASQQTAVLWAPNMSLGIAVFRKLIRSLGALSEFDVEMNETHHVHKKDRPSGTAILLQKELEQTFDRKISTPHSVRLGGVIGDHELILGSEEEILKISHHAISRSVFARGALRTAKLIAKRKAGLFQMEDFI